MKIEDIGLCYYLTVPILNYLLDKEHPNRTISEVATEFDIDEVYINRLVEFMTTCPKENIEASFQRLKMKSDIEREIYKYNELYDTNYHLINYDEMV